MFELKEQLGEILSLREEMPGVYSIETEVGKRFSHEYYAVLDTAPLAAKVSNYGEKMDGLRLFSWNNPASGCKIIHYEVSRYNIAANKWRLTELQFRDMSLHAMELHPEYFGMFPVPFHTPRGRTLRHQALANGIYWLETSVCEELLAVCFPIWNAELSLLAKAFAETVERDRLPGMLDTGAYLFFSREVSCLPIYELMETRGEWDGTVIDRPALMNAIWAFMPVYAMHLNGQKDPELDAALAELLEESGLEAMPGPCGKNAAGMFPDRGTDFLLLK